jgi:hypothetical protein
MKATLIEQFGSKQGIKKKTLSQTRLNKLMLKKSKKKNGHK